MDFNQLKYFCAIVKAKSITRAARDLFISQPALSNSLAKLERELNVLLFDRQANRIDLTEEGHLFYRFASNTLREQEYTLRALQEFSDNPQGIIHLFIQGNVYAVYHLVDDFLAHYPGIACESTESPDEADLLITNQLIYKNAFDYTPFLTQRLQVVVTSAHSYAGKEDIRLEELDSLPFVYLPHRDINSLIYSYFQIFKVYPSSQHLCPYFEMLPSYLSKHNAYAIVIPDLLPTYQDALCFLPFDPIQKIQRTSYLCINRHSVARKTVQLLHSYLLTNIQR